MAPFETGQGCFKPITYANMKTRVNRNSKAEVSDVVRYDK